MFMDDPNALHHFWAQLRSGCAYQIMKCWFPSFCFSSYLLIRSSAMNSQARRPGSRNDVTIFLHSLSVPKKGFEIVFMFFLDTSDCMVTGEKHLKILWPFTTIRPKCCSGKRVRLEFAKATDL